MSLTKRQLISFCIIPLYYYRFIFIRLTLNVSLVSQKSSTTCEHIVERYLVSSKQWVLVCVNHFLRCHTDIPPHPHPLIWPDLPSLQCTVNSWLSPRNNKLRFQVSKLIYPNCLEFHVLYLQLLFIVLKIISHLV